LQGLLVFGQYKRSGSALANSRLTMKNNSAGRVTVDIYNGDDSVCAFPAKTKYVEAGETQGMGCAGGGKHRCKVKIQGPSGKWEPCNDKFDTCDSSATKVPNHATLVYDQNYNCSF